ncbi:MAG: hypothetical protein ACRC62_33610 [Microcoleus sp.]
MEFTVVNILTAVAFLLLVAVTGGVAYLTAVDWRDRRRLNNAKRNKK